MPSGVVKLFFAQLCFDIELQLTPYLRCETVIVIDDQVRNPSLPGLLFATLSTRPSENHGSQP